MADTETIRIWYHHDVVLNHRLRGRPGYEPVCNHHHPTVDFPREGGGFFSEPVHPLTREAWEAYVQVMKHHGETMPGAGGVDQCRNIGTSDDPSLHAYLCACDLPPNDRKSDAFIRDIEKIRTNDGAQAFRNLRGDRMHDQINCSPGSLGTGIDWTTVVGAPIGDDEMLPIVVGDNTEDQTAIADMLNQTYGSNLKLVEPYNAAMVAVVKQFLGKYTGHPDWKEGRGVGGKQYSRLIQDYIKKFAVPGPKGDDGARGSKGIRGATGADGADGADGTGLEPGDTLNLGTTATVLP